MLHGRSVRARYLYSRTESLEEDKNLSDLPTTLKVQLAVVLNADFLKSMPVFKFADRRCIAVIVMSMKNSIHLPKELVIQMGSIGDHLWFVRTGSLEVYRKNHDEHGKELGPVRRLCDSHRSAADVGALWVPCGWAPPPPPPPPRA